MKSRQTEIYLENDVTEERQQADKPLQNCINQNNSNSAKIV